jgi:hypothetical protein
MNWQSSLKGTSDLMTLSFVLLITEVVGSEIDVHPTTAIFESDTITFSSLAPAADIHAPLPDPALVPDNRYAFVPDAFETRNGLEGTARIATNGTYADGEFYFNQGLGGDTRDAHFANQWFFAESISISPYHDMAFQMN